MTAFCVIAGAADGSGSFAAAPILYVISLIVGGGLLLLSTFFGGHSDADGMGMNSAGDADFGGDVSADAGTGADVLADADAPSHLPHNAHAHGGSGHGISLATWFSLQFVIYFLAAFGLIGTTLTYASTVRSPLVLLIAVAGGAFIGQFVHQALRGLKNSGVGSDPTKEDYVNRAARVTIAIAPTRRGEVVVATRTGERFVAAVAKRHDDGFALGDRVVVVGFDNGVAEVVSRREYEFVTDSQPGGNS